jgi:Flp pilus assembly protein TadG
MKRRLTKRKQEGSVIIEFALVLLVFLMFAFGIMEFARLLYTWQVANEATREGARYAVACADPNNSDRIKARMKAIMPQVDTINVVWQPAGCNSTDCEAVTVSITGMNFKWIAPLPGATAQPLALMPGFSTYLQREMMTYNPLIC